MEDIGDIGYISKKMPQSRFYREKPIRVVDSKQTMYQVIKSLNADNMDYNSIGYMNHNYTYEEMLREVDKTAIALNEEEMYQKLNEDKIYDLILIDDIIPKFNDLFSEKKDKRTNTISNIMKKSGYDIPIVIMVTENNNNLEEKYLDLGFKDYLSKPVNKGNLNNLLIKYLKENKKY